MFDIKVDQSEPFWKNVYSMGFNGQPRGQAILVPYCATKNFPVKDVLNNWPFFSEFRKLSTIARIYQESTYCPPKFHSNGISFCPVKGTDVANTGPMCPELFNSYLDSEMKKVIRHDKTDGKGYYRVHRTCKPLSCIQPA